MLSAMVVGLLVGLALPIVMVLVAITIDGVALLWIAARAWHDEWSPQLVRFAKQRSQFVSAHTWHWHRHAHR